MNEALKYRIIEQNSKALTQHFLVQLCRMEEKLKEFEARLNDLQCDIHWLTEELKSRERVKG